MIMDFIKKTENKIFLLVLTVVIFFGFIDSQQILGTYLSQNWDAYNNFIAPYFIVSWYLALIGMGVLYYLLKKDKSEALSIVAAGFVLLFFGLEDLSFFIFSSESMGACMDWFTYYPWKLFSCVTPTILIISSIVGIFISYKVFIYLRRRW